MVDQCGQHVRALQDVDSVSDYDFRHEEEAQREPVRASGDGAQLKAAEVCRGRYLGAEPASGPLWSPKGTTAALGPASGGDLAAYDRYCPLCRVL